MEKHRLKWLADTGLILQKSIYDYDLKLNDDEFMLIPSRDEKMQLFSPVEGFEVSHRLCSS